MGRGRGEPEPSARESCCHWAGPARAPRRQRCRLAAAATTLPEISSLTMYVSRCHRAGPARAPRRQRCRLAAAVTTLPEISSLTMYMSAAAKTDCAILVLMPV